MHNRKLKGVKWVSQKHTSAKKSAAVKIVFFDAV
jgi:hypothetical protein